MNKQKLIQLVARTLRNTMSLSDIQKIQKSLSSGELSNIFSDAVDKAIIDQQNQIFQMIQEDRG